MIREYMTLADALKANALRRKSRHHSVRNDHKTVTPLPEEEMRLKYARCFRQGKTARSRRAAFA